MFFIVGLFIIIAEKLLTLRTCLHFIGESKESAQLNDFLLKQSTSSISFEQNFLYFIYRCFI